jgi:DNA excision repair protein ERCC-2
MQEVYERFEEKYPEYRTILQGNTMNEEQREDYLLAFEENPKIPLVGFAVMGGIFGEGIDLKGNRLIGAIIVGVGLPQICLERNIIKDYFNEKNNNGFNYSYTYPGMNKVLQAAGRVIRTEKDKGVVLLIDERFNYASYKRIFPREWNHKINIKSEDEMIQTLEKFHPKN